MHNQRKRAARHPRLIDEDTRGYETETSVLGFPSSIPLEVLERIAEERRKGLNIPTPIVRIDEDT